ncbi:MAG TPA: LysM peptidoglycan-binding domain-containing protein [Actinocrinis sp.]|nr:LysM peptidoglycan-binding domain-containing protein [Actinocrinis sp.]
MRFGEGSFTAVTAWRERDGRKYRVLTFQVGGDATLGSLLEYLVELAAPGSGFRLEPPWDLLGRVELSRFLVTVDPSGDGSVELVYRADATLPMMSIETVGVRAERRNGRPAVRLILTGEFLGAGYPEERPLGWDLLSERAPAVPGAGSALFDLRYLGIGQRIALTGDLPQTVRDTVDRLADDMKPAPADRNPLLTPAGARMRFAPDSQWLIGLDATLAGVLDLAVVFNDPLLYGLSVRLHGAKAGALAGLAFEVLYKKVSDDVGVFRVELRIPDAFRRVELGAASLTLGVVVVEVYTDGSFLIDLGFPHGLDFSRSFSIQAGPFLGRGGVYFGVLDKSAGTLVPAVLNGVFSPVVALGVGLVVGIGREVRSGPLSGGAFVELIAVFEGVFAWFTPNGAGEASALYHRIDATVAVHGKVYGSVDLAVLHVSVTIEAWASVSVSLEAYRATQVALSAQVEVHASLEVLFIRLSFSFSASVDLGFTLGEDRPAPWILGSPGQSGARRAPTALPRSRGRRAHALPPLVRRPELITRQLRDAHTAAVAQLHWDPTTEVFRDGRRTAQLKLLPFFCVSGIPIGFSAAPQGSEVHGHQAQAERGGGRAAPVHRVAFCLFAPNGGSAYSPGQTPPAPSAQDSAQALTARDLPAQEIIEALLRWGVAAVTGRAWGDDAFITAGQLRLLADDLTTAQTASGPFGLESLVEFFTTNLHLEIAGVPDGQPARIDGTAVALPPVLTWVSPQLPERDFSAYNPVGPRYTAGAARHAARFAPAPPAQGPDPTPPDDPGAYEPFTGYVFRDWCLMVAKTAVEAAIGAMAAWPVELTRLTSLAQIADLFPTVDLAYTVRAGDTLESVAAALGATPDQLAYLDPDLPAKLAAAIAGAELPVRVGVSPETVAADAAGAPLDPGSLPLGTVEYQVAEGDTFLAIAERFGLSDPAHLFDDPDRALAADQRLLRADSRLNVPFAAVPWSGTKLLGAAVFFAHYFAPAGLEDTAWYAEAIFDRNRDAIAGGAAAVIPPGTPLELPTKPNSGQIQRYISVAGDTVPLLAAALSLAHRHPTGEGGPAQWPDFRNEVVSAPGSDLRLPSIRINVLPGESLERLALRTVVHAGNIQALMAWLGGAEILAPLFLFPVPAARVSAYAGEALASVAARSGLPLAEFARRVADLPILQASPAAPLTVTVTQLPIQATDTLVGAVLDRAALGVGANSARQLLSGLSLPAPVPDPDGHVDATGPLSPLFTLTGQMADGPAPGSRPPNEVALDVTVRVDPDARGWVTLAGSTVARSAGPGALPAKLAPFNPAAAQDPGRVHPGMILSSGPVDQLVYRYTDEQLGDLYPGDALSLPVPVAVEPLAVSERVPTTYGLGRKIPLQTPIVLPIPLSGTAEDALTGTATLWPFPAPLLALARAGTDTLYDVWRSDPATAGAAHERVRGTTFATLLEFGIRRIGDRQGVYEVLGADTADRALALAVYRYVTADTVGGTAAHLTVRPTPDASDTEGRAVLDADRDFTYLLRTNQSTQSVPPDAGTHSAPGAETAAPIAHAPLDDVAGFCMLLWQASVTGGAGCRLGFALRGGGDLPPGLFDEGGSARLGLLVVAGEQQRERAGRTLLPINTCAVAAPLLDPAVSALYLMAREASQTTVRPVLLPGTAGFRLGLADPGEGTADAERMRRLFSLATASVPAPAPDQGSDGRYLLPPSGLPVGPQIKDDPRLPLWERMQRRNRRLAERAAGRPERTATSGASEFSSEASSGAAPEASVWWYEHALPITRFGPPSPAPDVPGLPPADADPYRGISGAAPPVAAIRLGFADVLGNTTAATPAPIPALTVPAAIGYTDALLGVSAWPASTLSYAVEPAQAPGGEIRLAVTVAPQPAALAPGTDPAAARDAATRQAERYREIYYQLSGRRVTAQLISTLRQTPDGSGEPLTVDAEPLWRFAAASYVAAAAAAALIPVTVGGGTLRQIQDTYGVDAEDLALANGDRPIRALFGAAVPAVPAYAVFAAGDSADSLAAAGRPGWPRPADGAALLAAPQNAAVLPLRRGVVLTTPVRQATVPADGPRSLAAVALLARTEPGLLAEDNAQRIGILQPGFVFVYDALAVEVPEGDFRFDDVRAAFASAGVNASVAALATESADLDAMLRADARLDARHYTVGPADVETLAANGSGFGAAQLAPLNRAVPNLFDQGALVYLGVFGPTLPAPGSGETLTGYAARFACPPALLLAANADAALPADAAVAVPGAARIPDGAARPRVPSTVRPGESLDAIAPRFASTARQLGAANAAMPALAAGRTVTVSAGGPPVSTPTVAGDSFASVLARLVAQDARVTLDTVVAALAGVPGALESAAVLVCPTAVLPGSAGALVTPRRAAQEYGIDARMLAEANLGTVGLVAAGAELIDPLGGPPITTAPQDTFNALTVRLSRSRAGSTVTVADLVEENLDTPFLRAGAALLLPAAPITLAAPLGARLGSFAEPVFALTTTVRLSRPGGLVDEAFRTPGGDGPAQRADTPVPAPAAAQGDPGRSTLTLAAFAEALHTAFPDLRLATARTGRSGDASDGAGAAGTRAPDLWVVDFRTDGIAKVHVEGPIPRPPGGAAPRFLALRPLYTALINRRINVRRLLPDGTLDPAFVLTDVQGLDAEVPARRLLADVDLFLGAGYAPGLYEDPVARDALDRLLAVKRTLSDAVARGLDLLLEQADPGAAQGRLDAVALLRRELAADLSRAYDVAAVVQYTASVQSPWAEPGTTLPPARLLGTTRELGEDGAARHYTMSAAATPLDQQTSNVSFLMRVPDPARRAVVHVDLDYDLLDLQFGIEPVPQAPGFEDASWAAFYPPLAGTDKPEAVRTRLGEADVPIVLRSYPAQPVLLGHGAGPTAAGPQPPTLAESRLWTYSLSYTHEHTEQDEALIGVRFNVAAHQRRGAGAADDVAAELVAYNAVADDIWALLKHYAGAPGVPLEPARNAAKTFAYFAERIAAQWHAHWPPAAPPAPPPAPEPDEPRYDYTCRLGYAVEPDGTVLVKTVTLTWTPQSPADAPVWPALAVRRLPDGTDVPLEAQPPVGAVREYRVPQGVRIPVTQPPALTLAWPGLPATSHQNATAQLAVRRNRRLLGPDGPATRDPFVFTTPLTEAPEPIAPVLAWLEPIDITGLGPTFASALHAALLQVIAPMTEGRGTVALLYDRPVLATGDPATALAVRVPVALAPGAALGTVGPTVATAAAGWLSANGPMPLPGRSWLVTLTVPSDLDPDSPQPLLAYSALIYRL